MLAFLFIVFLVSSVYFVFHFKKEMFLQKRQLILLKHSNDDLKCKILNEKAENIEINVVFIVPDFNAALITQKCPLYLSPMESSPILTEIEMNTDVTVEDSAEINNSLWYEVCLNCENAARNKGWIEKQYILPKHDKQNEFVI